MPKTRWYHSAETSTSMTFATRSLRELTLMGIMYRQMIRWFVTKIYQVQAYTFCISASLLRSQRFTGRLSCSGARRFLYRLAFEKFSQRGFPSHFRSLGREEARHPHFHPHRCFPVTKFPAKAIRATTLLGDSNKVISMCYDRGHHCSNVLFRRRFKSFDAQKSASARFPTNRPRFESQSARRCLVITSPRGLFPYSAANAAAQLKS